MSRPSSPGGPGGRRERHSRARPLTALALRLFRVAMRLFPRPFRATHGAEMRAAYEREIERRAARAGTRASLVYAVRASADAARQGWRERRRAAPPPGHGARTPRGGRGPIGGGFAADVRLAVRGLRRSPAFAVAGVLVLALGIGANATVFSALRAAILAPAPYPEADRLVLADLRMTHAGRGEERISTWSYPKLQTLLGVERRLVDPAVGYGGRTATLTGGGAPRRVDVELVTPGYFELLGRSPVLGRAFTPDEADAGDPPLVAVLSHELWSSRYGADPALVGRDVVLNGRAVRVVGIAPAGFDGLRGGTRAWVPMAAAGVLMNRFMIEAAQAHWLHVIGRLAPGVGFAEADAWMEALGPGIDEAHPAGEAGVTYGASLRTLDEVRVNAGARAAVLLLSAAAGLVLLVACANLSGLLLARSRARVRDGAVRLAVGASRWRLVRASAVESLTLALLGGAAGMGVAAWGARAMSAAWPRRFLGSGDGELRVMSPEALAVDRGVVLFALAVSTLAALLFGTAPALRASGAQVAAALKDGGAATRRARRLVGLDGRTALVGVQVALALVLLVGTGLVGTSMMRLLRVDEGFDARGLLTFSYALPASSTGGDDPVAFHEAFLERVRALPGVEGVTVGCPPLRGHCWITRVDEVRGAREIPPGEGPPLGIHMVGDGHFETMGIPLLRGRALDARDGRDARPTIVLSRLAAERLFGEEDPIGRFIRVGVGMEGKEAFSEVVGVVGDVLYAPPDEEMIPEGYFSFREYPDRSADVIVRAADPMAQLPGVRAALGALDRTLPVFGASTMDEIVAASTGDRRVVLALLALFTLVTVLLSATGTWGIVAYSVADRRRELGLRIALGAGGLRVLGTVVAQTAAAAGLGLALGGLAAWGGGRLLEAFLYEVDARDPRAFAVAGAILLAVVALAAALPARRAARVDPVEALRAD